MYLIESWCNLNLFWRDIGGSEYQVFFFIIQISSKCVFHKIEIRCISRTNKWDSPFISNGINNGGVVDVEINGQ